jgi:hypothetical protein
VAKALRAEAGLLIGQVIKQYVRGRVVSITRRIVQGSSAATAGVLAATRSGNDITTAYIERLNATSRAALACWCAVDGQSRIPKRC